MRSASRSVLNTTFHSDASRLPSGPGAYILLIEIQTNVTVRLPRRPDAVLVPGRYLYCGSAGGPGGIKARVARHMRAAKTVRWHVDQVTTTGKVFGAWVFPGGLECELVAALSALPVPIPGFGSSDCRRCTSHLLAWPDGQRMSFESLLSTK